MHALFEDFYKMPLAVELDLVTGSFSQNHTQLYFVFVLRRPQ